MNARRIIGAISLYLLLNAVDIQAVTITAIRDTYVSSVAPTDHLNALPSLVVNARSETLIGFDLSALPIKATSQRVEKATLQLWIGKASLSPTGTINVRLAASDWKGPVVTYNTRPAALPLPLSQGAVGGTNYYLVIDVTDHVKRLLDARGSDFGFVVTTSTTTTDIAIDSKENETTSHPPLLDISLSDTTMAGSSFAACALSQMDAFGKFSTCECSGNQISKYVSVPGADGSCYVNSDHGPCSADTFYSTPKGRWVASCCVCLP